jgi:hypothetical protein
MVTSALPSKVRGRSVAGLMADEDGETGCAMWIEVKCSGSVPKAFEM